MNRLEELAKKALPTNYAFEWSGMSYQEKQNEGQVGALVLLAVLFAYLFLVAQYESWTIPMPVLMSVIFAVSGGLFGLWIMGLPMSIYAQLGLVLLIGLASKNAILIVEFARDAHEQGHTIMQSALYGTRERFRAVLMTAFTFILGVAPLVWATGASAGSRVAVGVPVFAGMIIGTFAGLVLIPLMYILIQNITDHKFKEKNAKS